MKNFGIVFFISFMIGFSAQGQTSLKNTIYAGYSIFEAKRYTPGTISARGFELGYSRYITDRFYGDLTYGEFNFEGKGSRFYLDPEEMDYFNMSTLTLGLGYDFYQSEKAILSAELAYLRLTTHELMSLLVSNGLTIRQTGNIVNHAPRVQLKARIFLTEHLQLVPAIAYGIRVRSKYTSYWFRAGLAYSF